MMFDNVDDIEELRILFLGYIVQKEPSGCFAKIEIALTVSREAVIENHIVCDRAIACRSRRDAVDF
jgi:hypothetical protein